MKFFSQFIFLLFLILLGAGGTAVVVSRPVKLAENEITFAAAQKLSPVLWIDARPAAEFEQGCVFGAVSLNEDNWSQAIAEVLTQWEPGKVVVVYCGGATCAASQAVAKRLRGEEYGLEKVFVLRGGWQK